MSVRPAPDNGSSGGEDGDSDYDPNSDGLGTDEWCEPPPPAQYDPGPPPEMQFSSAANISKEEVREAVLEFVAENCCYGKGAAEQMEMHQVQPSNAMHYRLETFCEGRSTARTFNPYHGGHVDGPENGPPPMPWDMFCEPRNGHFMDQEYRIAVPHTDEVRQCNQCCGSGRVRCGRCHGSGRVRCRSCGGDGRVVTHREGQRFEERCGSCGGDGRCRCLRCGGDGRITCPKCTGSGRLKYYIELAVKYINHIMDYVSEDTEMPDHLVKGVEGVELYHAHNYQVFPIVAFPIQRVNDNSQRLVAMSKGAYPRERWLDQRHNLRAIPVTEVHYTFKDHDTKLWVYGNERKVYAPDYPQQCCWGCTVL